MSRLPWRPLAWARFVFGLSGIFLLPVVGPVHAHTSTRVALDSNILVGNGRVVFAQGTGSLTVLDLETGDVLLRKKPQKDVWRGGQLEYCADGVLMIGYQSVVLLDKNTLDPIWQADASYDTAADGEYVVSHDGNHTVSCRKIRTGKICWTVDMEGGWRLLAAKGKAVLATPNIWEGRPTLLVLDLQGGHKLLHHQAARSAHWLQVYFDGEWVYVVDGSTEQRGFKPKPASVTALNLQGEVVAEIDGKSPELIPDSTEFWNGRFYWEGKYFSHEGRVRPVYVHEPKTVSELWRREHWFSESLPSGVFVHLRSTDVVGETGQLLKMIMPDGSWKVYASHLGTDGHVIQVGEAQGRLLLGSSEGHVECLDTQTGRPRWIYMFPVIRRTMSYTSPHGMPPYLTEQAAEYRNGVGKMDLSGGSIPLPDGFDAASAKWRELRDSAEYAGRIVFDPNPDDPFPDLGWYFLWLAVYAVIPIIGVSVLLVRRARRETPDEATPQPSRRGIPYFTICVVWCLVLSVSPAFGMLQYGRVSYSSTLALKVVFAMAILCAAYGTVRLYIEKRWVVASVLAGTLISWVYLMWYPWWFA